MTTESKLIFMRQYLKTDPKQSLEVFLTECIDLFQKRMGERPNCGMCPVDTNIWYESFEVLFTQSRLCQPNNIFLWYEEKSQ